MIKTSVYVGTSVDRFIARPGGDVDFLDPAEPVDGDMGFGDFMATIDVLVMGRNTWDTVMGFMRDDESIEWPYGETPVIVLTHRSIDVPEALTAYVEPIALEPIDLLAELGSRGHRHAYIDGGATVQAFLRADLIDELIVTDVPVLIGQGIPLFGELTGDVALRHVDTVVFANGCVRSHYEVNRRT